MNFVSPFAPKMGVTPFPVNGVRFATHFCGLKASGGDDLLLVVFDAATSVAGVFTRSTTAAAPVDACRNNLRYGQARALVVHSGNANAFTGKMGETVVRDTENALSEMLDCPPHAIFSAATGIIGQPFPSNKVVSHLAELVRDLDSDGAGKAAQAIMTTDTFPKIVSRKITIGDGEFVITGLAKGAGMIAPDMATLLAFVFTDAAVEPNDLQNCLNIANQESFSKISVDGDTSTNDTVLAFATGNNLRAPLVGDDLGLFQKVLAEILTELSLLIVKDGEGISKFITITVSGARTDAEALKAGLSIAGSPLVKTAIAGGHPNWGRIVMAVGKSGATVNKREMSVAIGGITVARNGDPVAHGQEVDLYDHMSGKEIAVHVDLAAGSCKDTVYTCDLTHNYVEINAFYKT